MTRDDLLAFCAALPPSVARIRFTDPDPGHDLGEVEIELRAGEPSALRGQPDRAAPIPPTKEPLTAAQLEAVAKAKADAARPRDVDSLAQVPPVFFEDEP